MPTSRGKRPASLVAFIVASMVGALAFGALADDRCGAGRHWSATRHACVREPRAPRRGPATTPTTATPDAGSATATTTAALAECPAGQSRSADTDGHCCWPGQLWSPTRGACAGRPTCPAELELIDDDCRAPCRANETRFLGDCTCAQDFVANEDTRGHCCRPGQLWSAGRSMCVGTPTYCPRGTIADAATESCRLEHPPLPGAPSCAEGMIGIPATTFTMGPGVEAAAHEVSLSAYCIDAHEVTVNEYVACLARGGCTPPNRGANWEVPGRADFPVDDVDWQQASRFCAWRGVRLPTEAEWELAARGTDGRTYPWGNAPPDDTRLRWSGNCGRSGCAGTSIAVEHYASTSPYGLYDMAGNVWEWTSDRWGTLGAARAVDPRGATSGDPRVIRGGGFHETDPARVAATARGPHNPSDRHFAIGFRCATSSSRPRD